MQLLLLAESINDFKARALEGSVFDDYGTMMLMRAIGSIIAAILIIIFVFGPLYTILWKFLRKKFPGKVPNLALKGYKMDLQNRKDYKEYKAWAAQNGYQPVVAYEPFLKKTT